MSEPKFYVQLADGEYLARFNMVWHNKFGDDPSTWSPTRDGAKAFADTQIIAMRAMLAGWHGALTITARAQRTPTAGPDRRDYVCAAGTAAWWSKDGAWHVAVPEPARGTDNYWTADTYPSRGAAIAALLTAWCAAKLSERAA